jgi:hypothetical protein
MVHDEMERGLIPVVAKRLRLSEADLTVRLCAAAVTGAFRVIDEDISRAVVIDENEIIADQMSRAEIEWDKEEQPQLLDAVELLRTNHMTKSHHPDASTRAAGTSMPSACRHQHRRTKWQPK